MKETQATAKMVQLLNSVGECRAKKKHSGSFGGGGEPDVSGVYRGLSFFIEMKVLRGGQVSKLQAEAMDKWRLARAAVFVGIYCQETKRATRGRTSPDRTISASCGGPK